MRQQRFCDTKRARLCVLCNIQRVSVIADRDRGDGSGQLLHAVMCGVRNLGNAFKRSSRHCDEVRHADERRTDRSNGGSHCTGAPGPMEPPGAATGVDRSNLDAIRRHGAFGRPCLMPHSRPSSAVSKRR